MSQFKAGELTVDPGATILLEDDTSPYFFTLLDGWVFWHKHRRRQTRLILGFGFPGDLLGTQAVLSPGMRCSVTALTAATLCVFDRDGLEAVFRQQPPLALALTRKLTESVAAEQEMLASLRRRSVLEGAAFLILTLHDTADEVSPTSNGNLNIPLDSSLLADTLGVAHHHAERALVKLQQSSLVEQSPDGIVILDRKQLEETSRYERRPAIVRPLI
ncbi:Crp/Fnr family transcriptional regulator [Algihabitans albus]|uniref:Crp/Fnr family transcriptional regulator n=1 Tax=Algihabitans albus TaxID=2164067 RepID=UPI0013C3636B|nr:Crp/Fnr family transcriptional regulator [Algihabitans albus]